MHKILSLQHIPPPSSVVFRRSVLIRVGEWFDPSMPTAEDVDLWIRMAKFYDFAHIHEPLVRKWFSTDRLSWDSEKMSVGHKRLFSKHQVLYKREGIFLQSLAELKLARRLMSCGDANKAKFLCFRAWQRNPHLLKYLFYFFLFSFFLNRLKNYTIDD